MTRVLIVGASGYIGSRLAERLTKRGEQLTLMSRDMRGMQERFDSPIRALIFRGMIRALAGRADAR